MAVLLDIPTLLVTVLVTYSVCAAALALLRWRLPSCPGLTHFLLGTLTTLLGLGIYRLNPSSGSLLSGVIANYLSILAVGLHLDGILRFYDRMPKIPIWAFTSFSLPLLIYWSLISPNTDLRVVTVIGPMAAICLASSWVAWRHSRPGEKLASSMITVGFGLFGLSFVVRLLSMPSNPWAAILDAGDLATASTFLFSSVAMVSSTLGLGLVATQRLVTELEQAKRAAEAGSRAKSDFLAVMSHEIRTPMNGVLGATSLILSSAIDPPVRRYAETIKTSGHAMLRIVDEVLDFSKSESGGFELEHLPFDLTAEVESTVRFFEEDAAAKGLELSIQHDERLYTELEGVHVLGDPGRLRQVLSNLLNNAFKFTHEGSIEVRLSLSDNDRLPSNPSDSRGRDSEPQVHVLFEVCDTGPGIAEDRANDLFLPFKQADVSTTRTFGGTGLGLAICKNLVQHMGGEIGVRPRSEPNTKGSVFWFSLPFFKAPMGSENTPSDPIVLSQIGESPIRALIAEDNQINQFVLSEMLEEIGIQVETADNGRLAVEKCRQNQFDLVLMDCRMPEMDGYEATRQIRATGATLPILAVTATAFEQDIQRCLAAGMDDVLVKPLEINTLQKKLDHWLKASDSR